MKKLFIAIMIFSIVANHSLAAKKKPVEEINTDAFTKDTQVSPNGTGDSHVALAWWIPNEFWESILTRDASITESDKEAMLNVMSGVSLLAVFQADISAFGAFNFYSKDEVDENMTICYHNDLGKEQILSPMKTVDPDLELVLNIFKPILGSAMGNLGNNMHFYVLDDKSTSYPRLIDPYKKGKIDIKLMRRDNIYMDASIEMPINALFVPRKCPNGKEAHISWKYCPWTGKLLEE